jgi:hypothetical protein
LNERGLILIYAMVTVMIFALISSMALGWAFSAKISQAKSTANAESLSAAEGARSQVLLCLKGRPLDPCSQNALDLALEGCYSPPPGVSVKAVDAAPNCALRIEL